MKLFRTRFNLRRVVATIILVALFLFPVLSLFAGGASASTQGGVLDTTWPAWRGFTAHATVVAPDGKIWVADEGATAVFNTTGSVLFSRWEGWVPRSLAIQETSTGTFILAGTTGVMYRYAQDGTRDTTFTGGQSGIHSALLVSGTGESQRIFAAEGNNLKRYTANGALESTVQPGGAVHALATQSVSGVNYVLVGGAFGLKRYSTASVLDATFTTNPGATVRAITVQSDGKFLVAGTFGLKRYNADGTEDGSFPTITTSLISLALQTDGKILAGTSTGLLRYSSTGIAETTFNSNAAANGVFETRSIALEVSGKIIAVGPSNPVKGFIRRYSWENVAPGAPLAPTAVASDRSAVVTVSAGSGVTPTGYTVYVKGDTSRFCVVSGASGNCTITGLTNGSSYSFYAVARNVDANSLNSLDSNSVTPADTVGPVISTASLNSSGTTLTLTYDEALGSTAAGAGAFAVAAGGSNFIVNSVTVSGSTVDLGLASVIGQGLTVTVSYAAPISSTSTTNSAMQDVIGNDALSVVSRAVTNGSTVDTTPPAYVSSAVNASGTTLTLTYGEAIFATTAPTSAFTVTVNSVQVTVNSVTVSGSTIQLGLASTVGAGQPVTFAYVAPASNGSTSNSAIQDAAGNDSVSLTSRAITTNSSTVDLTGPVLSTAVVNNLGTVLTLTYNEPLSSTTAPASRFTVTVGGVSRDVTSAVVSGSTVQLTLATTVGASQAVTIAYLAPPVDGTTSNSAVQDTSGNDALTLSAQSVTNSSTIDLTGPVISSSILAANGTTLTLSYNEALNATTAPTSAYTVLVDGLSRTISSAVVSGSTVVLTLTPAVDRGQVVTISYSAPTADGATTNNAIQDTVGNDAISLTARAVTNNSTVDTTPPVFVSAALAANGTTLTMTYNEALNATTAAVGDFAVNVNGSPATISARSVSGSTVVMTLSSAVQGSAAVTVAYLAPSASNLTTNNAVQDTAGNDAASLTATAVTNNSTEGPPRLISATVLSNGYQVRLLWSETLGGNSYGASSMFTILVNGSPVTIGGANYSTPGSEFTYNISPTITSTQTVSVSYLAPASNSSTSNVAVQDALGSDALAFSNVAVTNSSTVPGDSVAPTLLSASVNNTGTVLSLSYNETLNATTAPASAYTVSVNGVSYAVSSVAISNSVVQLTLGSSVEAGNTVTVSYNAPTPDSWANNSAVQDTAGNDAASLTNQAVTNNSVAGPDIAPPTLSTVSANGTSVSLTFNESLRSTPTPALNTFTVFVGETAVTPTAISISGNTVSLTLNGSDSVPSGTEVRVSYVAPTVSSSTSNAAIQDVVGNDALSFSGSTRPSSSVWDWVETFDPATMSTINSQCPGGGSINRSKRTALPNGVTYTVGVTGPLLCIHDVTESLSERGGAAGMFVATGLVTEPGLKITTSNDGCLANEICGGRGRMSLTFSQPVVNPVFSFAGWGGRASGVSWSEMRVLTAGVTVSKLSGTNMVVSADGKYVEDGGQSSTTHCNASVGASSAVCGSLQINGTISTVEFELFQQTSGGTGNEDTWNITASMAEDFGLVPTTYEASGVASHGVGTLRLGATVEADQASALYARTNADSVSRWTSLANNAKKDDGVAAWINSPTITFVPNSTYSTTVALAGVDRTANLCGWIDFNRDEYFAFSERACATDPVANATTATLTWTVPATVGSGLTYARVRLSYDTITDAVGKLGTGEVEDYSMLLPSDSLPAGVNDTSINGQDINQTISPLTNDQFEPGYPGNNSTLKLCGTSQTAPNCNVTILQVPNQGTYTVNADGTVTFDPISTFTGTATPVTYQITDNQAIPRTTSATITPTVVPRPTASADTTSGLLNVAQSTNPRANDSAGSSSAPLNATTVRLCGSTESAPNCTATTVSVTGGAYSVNQTTGVITFTPTTNYVGTPAAVTYQVKDSLNQTASSTYTPTIIATPTATNDVSSGAWNINQTITPFANDSSVSGHPLGSMFLCGLSPAETPNTCSQRDVTTADGTYTLNTNGTVTFDPLPAFTGTATQPVTYQAVDDLGQYVNATITPSVTPPSAPTAVADTSSNYVNVTQTKNVLTNDTTVDPLITLVATSVRLCGSGQVKPGCTAESVAVTGGTYSVNTSTGIVSFAPTTNWTGTATPVTYQVTDSTNQKVSATYTPTVIAAANDTSSGAWNINQTISPFSNDSAVTGHPFGSLKLCGTNETPNSCTVTTLVVDGEGTYTVNANGTVTFDPLPSFSGTATSIRYQAVDDLGQYVNATITPSVTAPPLPVAVADTSANLLNVVQTMNVLANDTTIDPLITLTASSVRLCGSGEVSPTCTATSVSVTGGTYSVDTATGLVSFTPTTGVSGTAPSVAYQVTSSTNQTVSSTYTPTVYPKPVGVNEAISGAYDTNQVYSPLTNDGFSSIAPVVMSTFKLCGTSQTPNSCSETTVTIANQGTYTINPDGTVTFNPLPSFSGVATPVQYQAADTLGQYVNATISPTVAAPTAPVASDETKSVLRGNSVSFTTTTGTSGLATGTQLQTSGANATCLYIPATTTCDPDNMVTIAGEGTFTLNPANGVVTYAADANATAGTKTSITYRVTDIVGQTDTAELTPVIAPPPVATNDTSTGNWDTNQAIAVLANDTPGAASAPLVPATVKLCGSGQTPNGCNVTTLVVPNEGTYTVQTDGNVVFDPLPVFTGTATAVRYQVADSLGQITTATITPTVRVAPNAVNDVSSENYDLNHVINPLANDVNGTGTIDPTTVKLCGTGQTAPSCTQTTLTVSGVGTYTVDAATGAVTFDPLPTFTGTAPAVMYQVSDSFGQTDSATITPTVGPPPLPVAVNDALTSNWDTNQTYTPTSNDTVGSSFPLIATTVKLCATGQTVPGCNATTLTVANEGTYTVNANGTVTFDPLPSFKGTATAITYQATDSLGRSDDATITPTVTPPPAPVATPETKPVIPGGTATFTTITGTSGLATGTQLQTSGDNKTCLITPGSNPAACDADNVVTIVGEGTFTLNPATGLVTFVADTSATAGTKTALTYRVTDVTGQTATSTLTPVIPQPPAASPDTNTGDWDTNQTISILTNDTAGDVTAPLVVTTVKLCGVAPSAQTPNNCTQTSLTIANQGTYTVNANGTVTFDPLPTFNGTATAVRYQVADTLGQVANTTITPTVRAPRAPTPTPDINTGNWDTNQTISPLTNDTPGEPTAPLVVTTVKLCGVAPSAQTPNNCTQTSLTITSQGTYTVNADGTVTFDPLPTFVGTATAVKYQVTDSIGQTVNTTITPTVLAPPPPVANPGTVSLIAGGTKEFAPIFGTSALAAKATGGPDLTNSTVCIATTTTSVCGTASLTIANEGTFTLDATTGIVTYTALSTATSGTKTAIIYKITDSLNVTVASTLTPSIIPKPTARPDTSRGVMEQTQTLSPMGNDSPGAIAYPLDPKTVLLCGASETAPACTQTTVTVAGQGTYVVQANGTVKFTPEAPYFGTATPLPYIIEDSLGQIAHSTLRPTVVPPPAPITELDTGIAEQGSVVVLSPWSNDNGGEVPAGVTGTVELVPNSVRLCGPTDNAPTCALTTLTTDDGTYTVDTTTGKVTFVHRAEFMGTVTQPVTYQIANNWTGLSGIGITTNILIPTIIPPAPPAPAPAPAPAPPAADPWAVHDVSSSSWDTNQIISVFANDEFLGSSAMMSTLRICVNMVTTQSAGPVAHGCDQMSLTIPGEGTYTVNTDGTVTFDPLSTFHGTATPIRYQAVDALGRYVNSTITPTVDAPPVIITVSNELPATGQNPIREVVAGMMLLIVGMALRRRSVNA